VLAIALIASQADVKVILILLAAYAIVGAFHSYREFYRRGKQSRADIEVVSPVGCRGYSPGRRMHDSQTTDFVPPAQLQARYRFTSSSGSVLSTSSM
jgi:hypothetical protein